MMKAKSYEEARNSIVDGDIVFLDGTPHSFSGALIQFATWSRYYHVGIAFWYENRLLVVDTNGYSGGSRIANMSVFKDLDFRVLRPTNAGWNDMKSAALDRVGSIPYAYVDAAIAYLKTFIKIDLNTKGEICSEYVSRVLNDAVGQKIIPDELITPKVLYKQLNEVLQYPLVLVKR